MTEPRAADLLRSRGHRRHAVPSASFGASPRSTGDRPRCSAEWSGRSERFVALDCTIAIERTLLDPASDAATSQIGTDRLGVWVPNTPGELDYWLRQADRAAHLGSARYRARGSAQLSARQPRLMSDGVGRTGSAGMRPDACELGQGFGEFVRVGQIGALPLCEAFAVSRRAMAPPRNPTASIPALRAALTPLALSSTTTQSFGANPMAFAACRNRSGAGFPRATMVELNTCGPKSLMEADHLESERDPLGRRARGHATRMVGGARARPARL